MNIKTITKSTTKNKSFPRVFKYEKKDETIITIYYQNRIETYVSKKNTWTEKDFKEEYEKDNPNYYWLDYLFDSIENENANGSKEVAGNTTVFKQVYENE